MDANTIIQIISSLGFPIVMCGLMAYYVKYISDKQREERQQLNEQHMQEINEMRTTIENNTIALQKLCDKLGGGVTLNDWY